jgi:TldD protein
MVVQGHLVGPLVQLVVAACESDRVLGLEADTAGTSFLTPPADVLRATAPQFSSRMSLHVTPTQTGATSFRWDDEGVENVPYPLIEHGHVVNFTTTRETASILTSAESSPGSSALRGGATTGKNHDMPMVGAPEITLLPNPQTATFDDLVREVAHGILIFGTAGISADTGLNTAIFEGNTAVIKKGIAIGRVQGVFGSFRTQKLWKDSIAGLGDASTSERQGCLVEKAMPPQGFMQVITAPAVLFKDVNVATYATLGATS